MFSPDRDLEHLKPPIGSPEELFNWWMNISGRFLTEQKIDPSILSSALSIVLNAFGFEWIRKEMRPTVKVVIPEPSGHQLANWLNTPGYFQICSVIELARYLRDLHTDRGFELMMPMLKSEGQFYSAFMQLAYAHRFLQMGAKKLVLEPDVDGGLKADIRFEYEGTVFLCECFIPEEKRKKDRDDWFRKTSAAFFEESTRASQRMILFADLSCVQEFSQTFFSQTKSAMITHMRNHLDSETKFSVHDANFELYNTSTMDDSSENNLFQELCERSTSSINRTLVDKHKVHRIRFGEDVQKHADSRFLIRVSDEGTVDETFDRLAKKISRKTPQVRTSERNIRGLIIVGSPLGLPSNEFVDHRHRETIRRRILDRYKNIAAIIFADRTIDDRKRSLYSGYFMFRRFDLQMLNFFHLLRAVELKRIHLA
jgi:hypothetical protein